jgi:GTP-binding protein
VGRPNVGKSAVFNRIAGKRVAIVHDQPGVTRDRVSREVTWRDRRFELIDTGGLGFLDGAAAADAIAEETRKQAEIAIADAAVILFVVDITEGVVPLDQEVARRLHASGRAVFAVANKADNDELDRRAPEFERLGFPVYPVAALHNRGFDPLMRAVTAQVPDASVAERPIALKVAIVGRPNAGKSSYINRLLRSDRVIVSETPGTTRDSIEIPFAVGAGPRARHYVLIDTAGMRKLTKIDNIVERFSLMRAEKSIEESDVAVLTLDGAQGPSLQDKKIAAKILECNKGCVILVSKWDLLAGFTRKEYEEAFRRAVPFLNFAPMVFVSALTGENVRKSIEAIDHVAAQISAELPTATLNRALQNATRRVQPPLVKGKRLKCYYATQTGTRPIRIRIFVNDPARLHESYRTYLISTLRGNFGLEGAPVILDFKPSHAPRK